ncbi:MAG: hypothetical protein U0892_11550 [Pirellulales bacterium]
MLTVHPLEFEDLWWLPLLNIACSDSDRVKGGWKSFAVLSESAAQARDGEGSPEDDQRVAEVALAGYRLMDPRRRPTLVERVQLLLWSEEELERPTSSLFDDASAVAVELSGIADQTLATAQPGTRVSELAGSAHNVRKETGRVKAMPIAPGEPSESEVALDVFRMLQQRDRHASALRIAAVVFVPVCFRPERRSASRAGLSRGACFDEAHPLAFRRSEGSSITAR